MRMRTEEEAFGSGAGSCSLTAVSDERVANKRSARHMGRQKAALLGRLAFQRALRLRSWL